MSGNLAELVGIDVPTRLLIGGEWTGGRGGGTIPVIDPATEDVLAEVADGTVEDALDAVGAAQNALAGWAATPPRQRAECLRRTFELMTKNTDVPGPADGGRERQGPARRARPRPPTRPSSSAGTPKRRCGWRAC